VSDTPINLGAMLLQGILARAESDRAKSWEDRGRLRGGSVGLVLEDGTVIGSGCPRAAYARFLGAEPPRDPVEWAYSHLLLDAGNASEDLWAADLKLAVPEHIGVLQEEDYPIEWRVDDPRGGDPVRATGREDIILADRTTGKPVLLGELKQVSSLATAVSVLLDRKPKLEHAIQSANYALRELVPVQLWYSCRVKLPFASWRWLDPYLYGGPYEDPRIEPFLERTGSTTRSKIKQLKPFLIGYQIGWDDDGFATVQALLPDGPLGEEWTTPINRERIDRFYESVLLQEKLGRLHPKRPTATDANGDAHGRFDPCKWCAWKPVCDEHEKDFQSWRDEVMSHTAQPKAKDKETA